MACKTPIVVCGEEHQTPHAPIPVAMQVPRVPTVDTSPGALEAAVMKDARLNVATQLERKEKFGMNHELAAVFRDETEFVSLGSWCGVACGLQALGLRTASYPFDWLRSPVEGLIDLIETEFTHFNQYMTITRNHQYEVFSTPWGGSFWHHDVRDRSVQDTMQRRCGRFLGYGEVPMLKPRVFIRAVNSLRELSRCESLLESLQDRFPDTRVMLLLIVDYQQVKGPMYLSTSENLIVFRIHEAVWGETGDIYRSAEAYAEAIAHAIGVWSGRDETLNNDKEGPTFPTMRRLMQNLANFDAGNPQMESFCPKPVLGARMEVRRSAASLTAPEIQADLLDATRRRVPLVQEALAPPSPMPPSQPASPARYDPVPQWPDQARVVDIPMRDEWTEGQLLQVSAFGQGVRFHVPPGARPGQVLRLEKGNVPHHPDAITINTIGVAMAATVAMATAATYQSHMRSSRNVPVPRLYYPTP